MIIARTIRLAGANATAGDTFKVIFSPAPSGSVAVIINVPKRAARTFIAFPVVAAVAGCRIPKTPARSCRLVRRDELLCKSQTIPGPLRKRP